MFSLEEALKTLEGREEFMVKRDDGLVILDYLITFPDTFEGLRRNFRGVTFNETSGEIVSLPLHKFFNVGQTEETQFHALQHCTATIYEKLDGSMIHFYVHPGRGELLASTRKSSSTSQALAALKIAKSQNMESKILESINEGWTPIFEYVAANNQIVVEYDHPRLVYLISRNRKTGEYRFEEDRFVDVANRYVFEFAKIDEMMDRTEFEGYVCHLDNGMIVKKKTEWYLERHRCVDMTMRPKYRLYEAVYNGVMDDIIPIAPDRLRPRLEEVYRAAQQDFLDESRRLEALAVECRVYAVGEGEREQRKGYALHVQANHKDDMSVLMLLYQGRDFTGLLQEILVEGYKKKYPDPILADLHAESL
jgi:RNA ligase